MEINKKEIDSASRKIKKERYLDYPLARFAIKYKNQSILFSKWGQARNFSTENLYYYHLKDKNDKALYFSRLDGFLNYQKKIPIAYAVKYRVDILQAVQEKYGSFKDFTRNIFKNPLGELSTVKLWNASIVGALFVGMILMTFIYRYLGEDAAAKSKSDATQAGQVLGDSDQKQNDQNNEAIREYVAKILEEYQKQNPETSEEKRQKFLEQEIDNMVKGYPIEKMVPLIAKQDTIVAAFIIGIARQESTWGVHVPVDENGDDCFNYWGFKGKNRVGTGGHSCFASREDAVNAVAKRLSSLVSEEKVDTPGKMVTVWKCGYDCSWDNPKNVAQWVSSVSTYFQKLNNSNG